MSRPATRRVALRPVEPDDYPTLHALENDATSLGTWRYRGALPPLEEYEQVLWPQTAAIQVATSVADDRILGYCQLYDVDLRAGHGWYSVYAGPDHRGHGLVMEGCMVFLEWAFRTYPFRWLYAHALDVNWAGFASSVRRPQPQHLGVLRDRALIDDEFHDVHVLGIEREQWRSMPIRNLVVRAMGERTDA